MIKTNALQLSYLHKTPEAWSILVRGVFWPLWPLRGKVVFLSDHVQLKLPGAKPEVLRRDRIHEVVFDKLGAGVFVVLTLKPVVPEAEPATETPAPTESEAPVEAEAMAPPKPVPPARPAPAAKGAAKPAPPEEPKLEKRYLGFFSDPLDAQALTRFVGEHGYGVSAWFGNWRKENQVPC